MSVKKGIVFLLLFFTGLVKILANPLDSLHLSDPQLDSLGNAIKADFEQIETQLKRNAANNQDENPVFVFHSSVSFGQQAGETYLYWNKPMSHPVVKASYGLANAGEEAEINTMLADLYNQTKRKMVVYMTSIARYPEVRLYKDGALVENGPTGRNAPQSLGSSVNTATDIVKKILYSSDASNRDFTTVVVVRVAQFNCDVKKKNNGKSTWEFETDKDVAEKISLKHSIRVVPANYISTTCISAIKSGFSNELKSDLKTFVSNVTTQFKSVQCDPPVECTSPKAAAFKQAIINAKADEIFKAISDLLTPKGQVITGPRTIKPGDKGAAYDEYMKVLSLCLNNTERVSAIKTFLGLAWTSTPYEQVIVDIIRYAPRTEASVNSLFNELEKQNIVPDLVSSVQGDNYETLISTLLELHQLRKFTATSPVVYWGTFTQNGVPSYKEGAYINTILQPDGKITAIGSYKYEFKTTDVQVRPINEMLNPFQNVCLTFISTPSKLTSNTYQLGKIYNIPAIYLWYINKTTWNGILIASAIDAFELAMTPAAIAEIRLAKGLWKTYLVSMTVVNSAQFGLKYAAVRGQIPGLDGGTEFLNSWDKLVLYSNLAYFSPFALQNAKKLLASYVKCKSGLKANLSAKDFEVVENTITKADAELKSVGIVEVVNGDNVFDLAKAEQRYTKTFASSSTKPFGLQMSLDEVENVFGANGKKLVIDSEKKAKEIINDPTRTIQGDPVLTGLVDNKTGQIFYGRNLKTNEIDDFIENLHPILKKRLEFHNSQLTKGLKASVSDIQRAGIPASHSEIVAINDALKARGLSAVEEDLADFIIHNKKLGGEVDNLGIPKGCPPRCAHCWFLSDGVKVIGND